MNLSGGGSVAIRHVFSSPKLNRHITRLEYDHTYLLLDLFLRQLPSSSEVSPDLLVVRFLDHQEVTKTAPPKTLPQHRLICRLRNNKNPVTDSEKWSCSSGLLQINIPFGISDVTSSAAAHYSFWMFICLRRTVACSRHRRSSSQGENVQGGGSEREKRFRRVQRLLLSSSAPRPAPSATAPRSQCGDRILK